MQQPANILIRLPNWLGDMVMATSFVKAVQQHYPSAHIDLIAKRGIDFLLDYFPEHRQRYVFSKDEYKGITGAWKFGKKINEQKKYDLFFCLPDSFSSGTMAYAIGAKIRIGYRKELRSFLFTHSYQKKKNLHRVEEYIDLLQQYLGKKIEISPVSLKSKVTEKIDTIIININSEASSRRLPKEKAINLINTIRKNITQEIILIGSCNEKDFVDSVYFALENKKGITNLAGKTSLQQMVELFGTCKLVLSTDSGPAHIANALNIHSIVLFGAGNENNTAPYNKNYLDILRLGKLECEPCVNNNCKLYGIPQCLMQLDENIILRTVIDILNKKNAS